MTPAHLQEIKYLQMQCLQPTYRKSNIYRPIKLYELSEFRSQTLIVYNINNDDNNSNNYDGDDVDDLSTP